MCESISVCAESVQECAGVCRSVCRHVQECVGVCRSLQKFAGVCISEQKCV